MKKQNTIWIFVFILIVSLFYPVQIKAQDIHFITMRDYIKLLEKYSGGKEIEISDMDLLNRVNYADAAVLAERADVLRNGNKESKLLKKIKENIFSKNRISDRNQIPKTKQEEVIACFAKGIFTGKSNGRYSQSDSFSMEQYLTISQAKTIAARIKDPSIRRKISMDGQVIRTTNLPKNADKFPYILESIPNSYYDSYFIWEGRNKLNIRHSYPINVTKGNRIMWDKPYSNKKFIDESGNREKWAKKIEENLKYRLNFNYKTVDNQWISGLRKTYFLYHDTYDKWKTNDIKQYVKDAKKNHIVIKAETILVEPSSLYHAESDGTYYYRCYAKFKVNADKAVWTEEAQRNGQLIFEEYPTYHIGLKNNQWYSIVFDLGVGTGMMDDLGHGYGVYDDKIYNNMRKFFLMG